MFSILLQAQPQGQIFQYIIFGGIIFVFYFFMIRPQQKKAKEHQAMLGNLSNGDEVLTAGGLVGKVVDISEGFVTLEIAENVRVKVQKFQVSSLVPKGTLKG